MIKHIVMWKLKESAGGASKNENAARAIQMLTELKDKIPSVLHIEAGRNLVGSEAEYDLALYSEFADLAALDEYQKHPEHLAVAEFIAQIRSGRAVVDYELETN